MEIELKLYSRFFKNLQVGEVPLQVLYDLRELTGFESGVTLHQYFWELVQDTAPSGYTTVARKQVLGIINRYPEFSCKDKFFASCEKYCFYYYEENNNLLDIEIEDYQIVQAKAQELWTIIKLLRKPNAYANFIRKMSLQ